MAGMAAFVECFWVSLRLGVSSFGGPVAHLAYFREAYVERLGWLDDEKYAELISICQFIPGPASSQLGAAIGYHRGGWAGAAGTWLGFTLPSALILILLATGLESITEWIGSGWIHGLKVVAVAVVCMAIIGMRKKLCPDRKTMILAAVVASILICVRLSWLQPLLILASGVVGAFWFQSGVKPADVSLTEHTKKRKFPMLSVLGVGVLALVVLALSSWRTTNPDGMMVQGLTKTGALVFGGGHVVLPLLEAETVGKGLMSQQDFLAGYGAAQAVPGPMFTLAAYLGARTELFGNPWLGGVAGVAFLFLPGMILLALGMPLWNAFKGNAKVRGGLVGASAAVIGLLVAALVHIVRAGALHSWFDVGLVLILLGVLMSKKLPVWAVVLSGAMVGALVY